MGGRAGVALDARGVSPVATSAVGTGTAAASAAAAGMPATGAPNPSAIGAAIAEQAPDAIIAADRDGSIVFWNRAATALFGHDAADVMGRSLDLVIPERLREAHWRGYAHAIETGTMKYSGRAMLTRSMHRDGRKLYVELAFGLLRNAQGGIVGSVATARDVTERQLAKAAKD